MTTHEMEFRGHKFNVLRGTTHPEYSLATFRADGEEYSFRNEFWLVEPGDVVVDVGASYGAYSLTALAAGASQVWAFEPEPTIAPDLRRNLEANPEWEGLWNVYPMALSDSVIPVDMHEYAPHWPQQTITGQYNAAPLDRVVAHESAYGRRRLSAPDWLKVDVEGHETAVLRGAQRMLTQHRPTVIVECHIFLDATLVEQCRGLLEACGYTEFEEVERDPCVMLIAKGNR